MKLNLGCGTEYKTGYINIDAYDLTVADRAIEVTDLDYEDGEVESIDATQLIEHLGFIRSVYALSEWFRVLRPGGTLLIETPDLETSFKEYLRGNSESQRELLTWIYGFDAPGMQHKFCFSFRMLESSLKRIGFVGIKKNSFLTFRNEPVMRVVCEKPYQFQTHQTVARFRKELLRRKLVDIDNQMAARARESFIDLLLTALDSYLKKGRNSSLEDMVVNGAIHSPIMVQVFLNICLNEGLVDQTEVEEYQKVLQRLELLSLPDYLFDSLKKAPILAGEQERVFKKTCDLGRNIVRRLLSPCDARGTTAETLENHKPSGHDQGVGFFSEDLAKQKAYVLHAVGRKYFALGRYNEAIDQFRESVNLYRDDPVCFWNLARALAAEGFYLDAIEHYENALKLRNRLNPLYAQSIERTWKEELSICFSKAGRRNVP
jgi:predicted SAM-dependent methyltransferase